MENVHKRSDKTIEQYRHNIKLLKYHFKKEQKINQTLKYKESKKNKKHSEVLKMFSQQKERIYSMIQTVNKLSMRLKQMGLVLGDIFRMADSNYEGQITKEQFMKTILNLKAEIQENLLNQMFYAIDTSMNGMLSTDQYNEFLYAHGGSDSKEARNYQKSVCQKFVSLLKKKSIRIDQFCQNMLDPASVYDFSKQLKKLGLNVNQNMILLKLFDPTQCGLIKRQTYQKSMQNVKVKDQKQLINQKFQKGVKQLCVLFRDKKINPIQIYELSDVDGKQGITIFELEEGLKKTFPEETSFQIKKWVNLINMNGDSQITKEEFISSIRSFYSIQQIDKFSVEYEKIHPNLKKKFAEQQIPAEKIIKELSNKIEDNGITKKQLFYQIDINGNGLIDKEELIEGLKHLGIHIGLIGKVVSVFDRDSSGQITLEEWLQILGEDIEMQDIDMPSENKGKEPEKKEIKNQTLKLNPQNKKTKPSASKDLKAKQQKKPETKKNTKLDIKNTNQKKQKQKAEENIKKQKKIEKSIQKINSPIKQSKQPLKDKKENKSTNKKNENLQLNSKTKIENTSNKKQIKKNDKKFTEDQTPSILQIKSQDEKQQAEVDITDIQMQIATLYSRQKNKVLQVFSSKCKKGKNGVSQNQFNESIKALKLKCDLSDEKLKYLYQQSKCFVNGILIYTDWFNQLKEKYSIAEYLQSQEKPRKQDLQEQYENDFNEEQKHQQPPQDLINLKNILQSKLNETQKQDRNDESNTNKKRGEQDINFKLLSHLISENGDHSTEGYKLTQYLISIEDQLQKLNDIYLPRAKTLKKNKKIFVDDSFPANITSLSKLSPSSSTIEDLTLIKWKHYKEIYKNPQLFVGQIQPNDIKQGKLGDCYFLCSLAGLAEYKNLIARIFEFYDLDCGYFLIWLCIDGKWQLIEIDGNIPVDPVNKCPVFSSGNQEQLWVILLEKAYAKAYGDYEKINGGVAYEAIKDLSGAPGQSFNHNKVISDQIWKKLISANDKHFIMTCGTNQNNDESIKMEGHSESVTNEGLVLGHAYSILDVRQINKQRIIKLRNPWGNTQWKGDWSDESKRWTQKIKKQLDYKIEKNDGIFWMPFEAFYQRYATTAINCLVPNYYYSSKIENNVKSLFVRLKPNCFQNGFFMISQSDHRKKGLPPNTPYNLCHIIGFNFKKGKVIKKISDQKYLYQREASVEFCQMEPDAEAVLIVKMENECSVNLCSYTNTKIQFKAETNSEQMMVYIEALALIDDNPKNSTDWDNMQIWMTSVGEIAFFVCKSKQQKPFDITFKFANPSNLKLISSQTVKLQFKTKGDIQTVKAQIIDIKKSYSFGSPKVI